VINRVSMIAVLGWDSTILSGISFSNFNFHHNTVVIHTTGVRSIVWYLQLTDSILHLTNKGHFQVFTYKSESVANLIKSGVLEVIRFDVLQMLQLQGVGEYPSSVLVVMSPIDSEMNRGSSDLFCISPVRLNRSL
jgi:hypothetical protein